MKGLKELAIGIAAVTVVGGLCTFAASSSGAPARSASAPFASSTGSFVPAPGSSAAISSAKRAEASLEAEHAFDDALARYAAGQGSVDEVVTWSTKARDWDSGTSSYADHRDRLRKLEKAVAKRVAAGSATTFDQHVAAHHRALAEYMAP